MLGTNLNRIVLLYIVLLVPRSTWASESISAIEVLKPRNGCGTNALWQATKSAWASADADQKLAAWWKDLSSKPHGSLANELGRGFGEHFNSFECGIGAYSTCITTGCSEYEDNGDPIWSYLALQSIVNLNQFFNAIYIGITNGQAGYLSSINDIANIFFPWKDPDFVMGDAAFWFVALITSIFAIPAGFLKVGTEVAFGAIAFSAFVGAGVQQVSSALEPGIVSAQMTKDQGLAKLGLYAAEIGTTSRQNIEIWANATMHGEKDSKGNSILNYLHDGSFLAGGLPTNSEIEQYYKKQMISRTINSQWRKEKLFVVFHKTDDPNDASGPSTTKYYSAEDGGVYYLYRYIEDGVLRGHLDKPWGLDYLNGTTYGISGNDITKSSALAFRAARFDYTQEIATNSITESMSSNGSSSPYKDGAGWEGTWTIPVCDIGTNNWTTQFGDRKSQYGKLPCCCGPSCKDTKDFVQAANLQNFQTLLHGCKAQLRNEIFLNFEAIDYGFKWKSSLPYVWATFSTGQKVGVAFALIFGGFTTFILLICCLRLCCGG